MNATLKTAFQNCVRELTDNRPAEDVGDVYCLELAEALKGAGRLSRKERDLISAMRDAYKAAHDARVLAASGRGFELDDEGYMDDTVEMTIARNDFDSAIFEILPLTKELDLWS